jgi:hypothetical protein
MMLQRRGDRTRTIALGMAFLLGSIASGTMVTAETSFDFTGHWTGVAQETGKPQLTLVADLAPATRPRHFTGTLVVEDEPPSTCTVKGVLKKLLPKVKVRLHCDSGTRVKLHGDLDAGAQTITGQFVRRGRHRLHTGDFTLAKQPA